MCVCVCVCVCLWTHMHVHHVLHSHISQKHLKTMKYHSIDKVLFTTCLYNCAGKTTRKHHSLLWNASKESRYSKSTQDRKVRVQHPCLILFTNSQQPVSAKWTSSCNTTTKIMQKLSDKTGGLSVQWSLIWGFAAHRKRATCNFQTTGQRQYIAEWQKGRLHRQTDKTHYSPMKGRLCFRGSVLTFVMATM